MIQKVINSTDNIEDLLIAPKIENTNYSIKVNISKDYKDKIKDASILADIDNIVNNYLKNLV